MVPTMMDVNKPSSGALNRDAASKAKATGATIEFQSVRKAYGSITALHDFSLTIHPGEFLTILGSSGSGKTTALNALAGFSGADSGDILIDGKSVIDEPPERRNLGMVFQNYSLFPHMTVFDNIAFPLRMRRTPRREINERVERVLEIVRLGALAKRMPRDLSGGQQQRVAFARAIVFEPPVLLMDEPLGALDLKLREALQFEIKEIQHQLGCTVVYVTHDQREALAMSSRIVVLRDGRIEQVGTPSEMYDAPRSRFVADFIGQTNLLAADLSKAGSVSIPELGAVYRDAESQDRPGSWYASVRPEKLQRRPVEESDIAVDVTVQEAVFLGDVIEYSARTPYGALIHFREQRRDRDRVPERGETISLVLRPSDVVLVPDLTKTVR
ncbi:ABC transporter ATP-binding protein (plasmid) [Azospirillum brasilense]|uniref:ABC transporter ATP-binding protein n=2 Tax=Azospirillum brasilense TaxID=192 RepID=A0A4D8R549_AZOBR|nr:ATP-binding cassette domain-containing protein [Azospirillum brasilense]QCO12452.1 ABC transporter ATP-binding protein [Azospirillum brasilense]QEL93077.1 ABC transporter ATP-binding protein [Azospirillum brasilense]QEL93581.1 ABC transporter ATP-binding protein [Azospirillum brasilense]QEL99398.1 ABC transporter ATP-binding protein [Azospirillum brasilense]